MTERRLVPATEKRGELKVKNSRFIATAAPALSVEAARTFVARIRAEFSDASHNVPAYLVGHGLTTWAHSQDDGEPRGTAGRPMLAVLQGSGLGDIAVVVTRYFGGTKLGTGGLVRAYGDAVRQVLEELPLAEKIATQLVMTEVNYSHLDRLRLLVQAHQGMIDDESFAAEVTVTARFPLEQVIPFQAAVREMTHGQREAIVTGTSEATLVPLVK